MVWRLLGSCYQTAYMEHFSSYCVCYKVIILIYCLFWGTWIKVVEFMLRLTPGIPARVLKSQLSYLLFLLWKTSFNSVLIPGPLMTQYVTPVFKKGDQTDAATIDQSLKLPISSRYSKDSYTKGWYHKETHLMEQNNLPSSKRHGFQKKLSCLTQPIDHVDYILKSFTWTM